MYISARQAEKQKEKNNLTHNIKGGKMIKDKKTLAILRRKEIQAKTAKVQARSGVTPSEYAKKFNKGALIKVGHLDYFRK